MEIIESISTRFADRELVVDTDVTFEGPVQVQQSQLVPADSVGFGASTLEDQLAELGYGEGYAGITDFDKVALVYYKGVRAGKKDCSLLRLVQIPLYFDEVKPFKAISAEHMRQREVFARLTGYVLIGPDECIAALSRGPEVRDYVFCDVFENNDLGQVRELAGIYGDSVDWHATPKRVADLNKTETRKAIDRTCGDYIWWAPRKERFSGQQRQRLNETFKLLEAHANHAPDERSASGAIIRRSFMENGSTASTEAMRPRADGWRRYPTSSDAWYFGVWVSPVKLETLTYAEQDVVHVICESREQFEAEMRALAEFHGQRVSPELISIGPDGTRVSYPSLCFLDGNTRELCFDEGKDAKDANGNWVMPLIGTIKLDHPEVLAIEVGQSQALSREACQLSLLDIRAYAKPYEASATRTNDGFTVIVKFTDDGQEFQADV